MNSTSTNRYLQGRIKEEKRLLEADDSDNTIIGTNDHDRINGKKGDDLIKARSGDDLILGGRGNDTLHGGVGDDILIGGMGKDRLNGGAGADTFFISYGKRTIEDFDFNEGDRLLFGLFLTNINYEQIGNDVLVLSDQGETTILNHNVSDFNSYGHP